ncbi:MAG: hypothetical protein P8076_15100 [Gammaproteobacteria bacterium]
MIRLTEALRAWGTPRFDDALKQELRALGAEQLPLQQGLTSGSYALADKLDAMVIRAREEEYCIRARVGIFYAAMMIGCSCADDPTPVGEESEYCEVELEIDKRSAVARVALAD